MMTLRLTPEEMSARKKRNLAIAGVLAGIVLTLWN